MKLYVLDLLGGEGVMMYEHTAIVGERGQITIPKDIREIENYNQPSICPNPNNREFNLISRRFKSSV